MTTHFKYYGSSLKIKRGEKREIKLSVSGKFEAKSPTMIFSIFKKNIPLWYRYNEVRGCL